MKKYSLEWIEQFRQIANANRTLRVLVRQADIRFLVQFGENSYVVEISDNELKPIQDADALLFDANWQFAVRAPIETWDKTTRNVPPPEFTDIIFMSFNGHMTLEGNLLPLWQNIRAVLWMFDLMRDTDRAVAA